MHEILESNKCGRILKVNVLFAEEISFICLPIFMYVEDCSYDFPRNEKILFSTTEVLDSRVNEIYWSSQEL